jgi:hypothetical protein
MSQAASSPERLSDQTVGNILRRHGIVNGMEVTRLAKDRVHTDGLIGFRSGHNLDIDADQVNR